MVSSSMILLSSCMTSWGAMGDSPMNGAQLHLLFISTARAVQSGDDPPDPRRSRIMRTALAASHLRLAEGCPCLLNSTESTSIWTTRPSGSSILHFLPYVLSENLLPMDMTRSAPFIMVSAAILPCIPRGPMLSS